MDKNDEIEKEVRDLRKELDEIIEAIAELQRTKQQTWWGKYLLGYFF